MPRRKLSKKVPGSVWILGVVSFFNDVSSEMLYPLLPIFITQVLGAPVALLGLIDGVAEGAAAGFKAVFGRWSDRVGKRRPFVISGYAASAASKIVVAASTTWGLVFVGRLLDKFGKGVRTGARDALLLEASNPSNRGLVFGVQQSLDSAGAVAGPLLALLLLHSFRNDIRTILYIAFIPSVLAVLIVPFVREALASSVSTPTSVEAQTMAAESTALEEVVAAPKLSLSSLPRELRLFLVASGLFALGNSSDSFLILRARGVGLSISLVIVAYVLYNVIFSAASTPAGILADRLGAKRVYIGGMVVYALVYAGFALNRSATGVWILFAIYGFYIALTDSVSRALVGSFIIDETQAAGIYGLVQTVISVGLVVASIVGGALWSLVGAWATFAFGAGCAVAAIVVFWLTSARRPERHDILT
ncbi:MAG TPA: MFS transporter [Acidimicrobiales bacterium]